MKRIISLLIVVSFICGAFFLIQSGIGEDRIYYTKITNKGKKTVEKINNNESITNFHYNLRAVNDQGESKNISFVAYDRSSPLKMNAYLKLGYDVKNGVVTKWQEIAKIEVPLKALTKLK